MKYYIEREAAAEAFEELLLSPYADAKSGPFFAGARDALKLARDIMRNKVPESLSIPSADVVERKTCHDTGESRIFRCSECGYGVNDIFEDINAPVKLFEALKDWRFCPCCGAQIVEEVQTNADR